MRRRGLFLGYIRWVLGIAATLFAGYCAWYHWGTLNGILNGAFALAGLLSLGLRSWIIPGALAGVYAGLTLVAAIPHRPYAPLVCAVLLAFCFAFVGADLERLEKRPAKSPPS
jgi:hypothetical protein